MCGSDFVEASQGRLQAACGPSSPLLKLRTFIYLIGYRTRLRWRSSVQVRQASSGSNPSLCMCAMPQLRKPLLPYALSISFVPCDAQFFLIPLSVVCLWRPLWTSLWAWRNRHTVLGSVSVWSRLQASRPRCAAAQASFTFTECHSTVCACGAKKSSIADIVRNLGDPTLIPYVHYDQIHIVLALMLLVGCCAAPAPNRSTIITARPTQ